MPVENHVQYQIYCPSRTLAGRIPLRQLWNQPDKLCVAGSPGSVPECDGGDLLLATSLSAGGVLSRGVGLAVAIWGQLDQPELQSSFQSAEQRTCRLVDTPPSGFGAALHACFSLRHTFPTFVARLHHPPVLSSKLSNTKKVA